MCSRCSVLSPSNLFFSLSFQRGTYAWRSIKYVYIVHLASLPLFHIYIYFVFVLYALRVQFKSLEKSIVRWMILFWNELSSLFTSEALIVLYMSLQTHPHMETPHHYFTTLLPHAHHYIAIASPTLRLIPWQGPRSETLQHIRTLLSCIPQVQRTAPQRNITSRTSDLVFVCLHRLLYCWLHSTVCCLYCDCDSDSDSDHVLFAWRVVA